MTDVQFRREVGRLGSTTFAEVAGIIVGMWEPANMGLGIRTGFLFRPQRPHGEKFDVVRIGNWTKREWQRLVRDFAADDQRCRKTFWESQGPTA